jgi:hypothetical protein
MIAPPPVHYPTPQLRPVKHSGACGERIPSPHPRCQAKAAPYNAAELVTGRLSNAGAVYYTTTIVRCHGCGATWQKATS